MGDAVARVLESVDGRAETMVAEAAELVRMPSVSGTDGENEAQAWLARRLVAAGHEVDHWPLAARRAGGPPRLPGDGGRAP